MIAQLPRSMSMCVTIISDLHSRLTEITPEHGFEPAYLE